jgi:choline dehydrogenase-like flavoprotein
MREHGPFPWGEGLGGAGFYWAGWTWRQTPWNFEIRSRTLARYGEKALPERSTVQDWPVTYDELELRSWPASPRPYQSAARSADFSRSFEMRG